MFEVKVLNKKHKDNNNNKKKKSKKEKKYKLTTKGSMNINIPKKKEEVITKEIIITIPDLENKITRTIDNYKLPNTEFVRSMVFIHIKRWKYVYGSLRDFYIPNYQLDLIKTMNDHEDAEFFAHCGRK